MYWMQINMILQEVIRPVNFSIRGLGTALILIGFWRSNFTMFAGIEFLEIFLQSMTFYHGSLSRAGLARIIGHGMRIITITQPGRPPGLQHPLVLLMDNISVSLIHISEPTRLLSISYAVFCLKK